MEQHHTACNVCGEGYAILYVMRIEGPSVIGLCETHEKTYKSLHCSLCGSPFDYRGFRGSNGRGKPQAKIYELYDNTIRVPICGQHEVGEYEKMVMDAVTSFIESSNYGSNEF